MRKKSIKLNAIFNMIRQSMSIVFPLITYPYVSRLLGADNLGRYSFSDSIVQIVITLSLIGIPTYAVREGAMIRNDESKICSFCSEIFTINCISALLSYAILLMMVLFVKRVRVECMLVGILSVNIMSKCLGRDWLNTIYEDYLYISLRVITVHFVSLILIFLLVLERDDLLKYVIIMASSELFGNILNFYYTRKKIPYHLIFSRKLLGHLKPILILFCSSIATTIYIRSDIMILGFLRPNSEVGVYTVSSKIYFIVKNLLNAVITVAIPRLSFYLSGFDSTGKEKYNALLNHLRNTLILLLFPAYNSVKVEAEILRCILEKKNLLMRSRGTTRKSVIYTMDALSAVFTVLFRGKAGEAYNATNPDTYASVLERARSALFSYGNGVAIVFAEQDTAQADGYLPERALQEDITKICELGWKPLASMDDIYAIDIKRFSNKIPDK